MRGGIAVICGLVAALAASDAVGQSEEGLRAQVVGVRSTMLAAGVSGPLTRLAVREGEAVAANAVIAQVDCSSQAAQRRVAEAKLSGARAKVRVNERLGELNSASVLEVELARAEAATAAAEIALIDTTLRRCDVRAPFAGLVVAKPANQHQHVREGDPLVELVDPTALEVELVVPARWLQWLKPGAAFSLTVDELDRTVQARVVRIAGRVDPVSQTVRVFGGFDPTPVGLLPGMSGTLRFP